MPDLMVQIDDQIVPLKDCFWVRTDADGCAIGSVRPDMDDELIATPQQAQREWSTTKRQREVDERRGVRHVLLTHEQWKEQAEPCFHGRCSHRKAAAS